MEFFVNNSSWSHSGNCKNNIFVLGKGLTFGINGNFGSPEKHVSINFGKSNTKFCLSLHYNADNSCLFGNGKKIFKIKAVNKNANLPAQFCFRIISDSFSAKESRGKMCMIFSWF